MSAVPQAGSRPRSVPRSGWMVIGGKEFGDWLATNVVPEALRRDRA